MNTATLAALGWGEPFESAFAPYAGRDLEPARIGVEHRNRHLVHAADAEVDARLSGKLKQHLEQTGDRPVVGDWIALHREPDGTGTIQARLPRKSQFSRKVAGRAIEEQVMAANIDVAFLATALTADLNPRRIERYLLMTWESGAQPVILLTKADLMEDRAPALEEVGRVAKDVPTHLISGRTGEGLDQLDPYLTPGTTVAVLGSSGVGKSTLINRLLGSEHLRTGEVRDDGRGRHTTTYRELVRLPSGALMIDTPGLRELQLWESDAGLQEAFSEIEALAAQCRFGNCVHQTEPGCAVRSALAAGTLSAERLESYRRLSRELQHIEEKNDARARAEREKAARSANQLLRKRLKEKGQ
ncbi:MAG: ribosome small subunit-dependent GTPase A [Gemmatimonadota bacterium]